jgi:TRAP-type mannitol/chloroaromatic compound transport system permease small subunit
MADNPLDPGDVRAPVGHHGTNVGNLFNRVVSGLNAIGTAWIFVMMILVTLDVTMRTLFNSPVKAVPLIITMSIIGIVFLQMSDALRAGRFTRSDVMIAPLLRNRPRVGHLLQMSYNAMGVFVMVMIFIYTIPFLEKTFANKAYLGNEGEFTLPEWPLKVVILIGSSCCAIQFIRHMWQDIRFLRGFRDSEFMGSGGGYDE